MLLEAAVAEFQKQEADDESGTENRASLNGDPSFSSDFRGPASIPFRWEERPEEPKKTPEDDPVLNSIHPCYKAVASVPFKWEEKPGKPRALPEEKEPILVLTLPPDRQNSFRSIAGVANSSINSPRSLSGRLKGIFQGRLSETHKPSVTSRGSIQTEGTEQEEEPVLVLTLPPHSQSSSSAHDAASNSATNSSRSLSGRLKSIFQGSFLETSTPSAPSRGSIQTEGTEQEEQEEVLGPCQISKEEEMFELNLNAFSLGGYKLENPEMNFRQCEEVSESSLVSKSSELRSSCRWSRPKISDSPPALLANCLLTMVAMSQAIPVDDSHKVNPISPSLIPVDQGKGALEHCDMWANMVENTPNEQLTNSCKHSQELMRIYSMQAGNPLSRVSSKVKGKVCESSKHSSSASSDLINGKRVSRPRLLNISSTPGPIDASCSDLTIPDEEEQKRKMEDIDGFNKSSSPLGSALVIVEGSSGASTPYPSTRSKFSLESNYSFKELVPSSASSEPGRPSESNKSTVKKLRHPSKGSNHIRGPNAMIEETKSKKIVSSHGKHSKRSTSHAKKQAFCMELKLIMIRCCSLGANYCSPGSTARAPAISCSKNRDTGTSSKPITKLSRRGVASG